MQYVELLIPGINANKTLGRACKAEPKQQRHEICTMWKCMHKMEQEMRSTAFLSPQDGHQPDSKAKDSAGAVRGAPNSSALHVPAPTSPVVAWEPGAYISHRGPY